MSEPDPKRRKTDEDPGKNQNIVEFLYRSQPKIQIPAGVSHVSTSARTKKIKEEYFLCCKPLRYLSVGKSIRVIGRSAFEGCSNLAKVDIQEGPTLISVSAFARCKSLVELDLPGTIQAVDRSSFFGCTSLIRVRCRQGMREIGFSAFQDCISLVDVTLPLGLETIGHSAFQGCTSLSAVAFPQGLSLVESSAFGMCENLMGVEIPRDNDHLRFDLGAFFASKELVNISLPPLKVNRGCGSLFDHCGDLLENVDTIHALNHRYEHHPVHEICYYSSEAKVDDLVQAMESSPSSGTAHLVDCLGMTPFHVVATSVHPRTDILQCLLNHYLHVRLNKKNKKGKTMMDYLIQHTSAEAVPALKLVLEKVIMASVSKWNLGDKHKLKLSRRLAVIPSNHDTNARRSRVNDFFEYLGYCARLEQTSLMELAMWKMKIAEVSAEVSSSETMVDRSSCLYQTGADQVVSKVISYLWGGESTSRSTALSIFRLVSEPETTA